MEGNNNRIYGTESKLLGQRQTIWKHTFVDERQNNKTERYKV